MPTFGPLLRLWVCVVFTACLLLASCELSMPCRLHLEAACPTEALSPSLNFTNVVDTPQYTPCYTVYCRLSNTLVKLKLGDLASVYICYTCGCTASIRGSLAGSQHDPNLWHHPLCADSNGIYCSIFVVLLFATDASLPTWSTTSFLIVAIGLESDALMTG